MLQFFPKKTVWAAVVGMLAGILFVGYISTRHSQLSVLPEQKAMREASDYWAARIPQVGAEVAKRELASAVVSFDREHMHGWAHSFGGALYATLGPDGMGGCDSNFSFGCYHEFLGRAIEEKGIASIPMLNQKCKEVLGANYLSCQHGIGHGVLAFEGYEFKDVARSMAVCAELPDGNSIGGCYGGVMMEYNLRTMDGPNAGARPYSYEKRFEPCSGLKHEFYEACIFWQPQWWSLSLREIDAKASLAEIYTQLGEFCTESNDREHCFEGIGNTVFIGTNADPKKAVDTEGAIALCQVAGRTPKDELLCRKVAANIFGIEVSHKVGLRLCSGLVGEAFTYCEHFANNDVKVQQGIEIPSDIRS